MNAIGRYRYIVLNKTKLGYNITKTSKNNPKAIGLFVAGGKAVDEKVAIANKQIVAPKQATNNRGGGVLSYIKNFFK